MSPSTLPQTQTAILFNTKSNTLSLSTTAPVSSASSEELLIAVHSTAITNGELTWAPFVNWPEIHIPCFDVSGTVVSLPSSTSTSPTSAPQFKVGDSVYGRIAASRHGAASQYATLLVSEAALVPQGLGMLEASTIPMSAHTAWQALFEQGFLCSSFAAEDLPHVTDGGEEMLHQAKGKRVLILGASGGVGLMAVQFAKLAGAWVAGTASTRNKGFLEELGIDEVVDYAQLSVAEYIAAGNSKFDLVLDCVGGKSMLDGWHGVKDDGSYVSVVPGFREPEGGKPERVRSKWFVMEARGDELARISRFFENGMLKTSVDSVWGIEDYERAFEKTAGGHARGKVVLRVGGKE